jgi:bis(5'-nucleosyl)-tetraphosphatase (symmetrical)
MAQICEITRKKVPHFNNLPEEEQKKVSKLQYRRILKHKFKVPEANGTINLKISLEGMEMVKKAGGLAAFLKNREDRKLSPHLLKLKRKIYGLPAAASAEAGEPKKEEKAEAAGEAAKPEAAPASAEATAGKPAPAPAKRGSKIGSQKNNPSERRVAIYVIGDIQGCFHSLQLLLQKIQFNESQDRLWLTGDLVNRGPRSLEVLRWAKSMGERLITVLGNHDLHLLGRFWGIYPSKVRDTLDGILAAPDVEDLISWLQQRPLFYREGNRLLLHAGLLPQWDIEEIEEMARRAENLLQSEAGKELMKSLPGKDPVIWDPDLKNNNDEMGRLAAFIKIITRMRICSEKGEVNFNFTGPAEDVPLPFRPWFSLPHRRPPGTTVYCGHWSSLGFRRFPEVVALDSGCVWGRRLTAYRVEDGRVFQVNYSERSVGP